MTKRNLAFAGFLAGSVAISGIRSAANNTLESLVPWFEGRDFDDQIFNLAGWLAWGLLGFKMVQYAHSDTK
jgi:hypothetical protein